VAIVAVCEPFVIESKQVRELTEAVEDAGASLQGSAAPLVVTRWARIYADQPEA
jgi:hypothetical protein